MTPTTKALMRLPDTNYSEIPDGFSKKEWSHKRLNGTVDHYLIVRCRSGPLMYKALVVAPELPSYWRLPLGTYELYIKTESMFPCAEPSK